MDTLSMINGDGAHLSGKANPIYLEGKQPIISETTAKQLGLRDGQIVQALVQTQAGQLSIFLKGRQIELPKDSQWKSGEIVTAQVKVSSNGVWTLQPISTEIGKTQKTDLLLTTNLDQSISKLSTLLFKPSAQIALTNLFQPGFLDSLFKALNIPQLRARWDASKLSMPKLTGKDIKQAIKNATGGERLLSEGANPTKADPKQLIAQLLNLTRFSNISENDLKGMDTLLRQGIDDLEAAQLHAVQSQVQNELMLTLVLPFKDFQPIELTFRRPPTKSSEEPMFTVNIHSKSQEFGELWLKTELKGTGNVDLVMWARREDIVQEARAKSSLLGDQLIKEGLLMQSFDIIHGPREIPSREWVASGRGMILDLKA